MYIGFYFILSDKAPGRTYQGRGHTSDARPNPVHLALASLVRRGVVHEWITTNHDGLAQKAGAPQEKVAEVFGSWFDPSNPPLGKTGKMRPDLKERLRLAAEKADLTLALGSSLCSSSQLAEAVVQVPGEKSVSGSAIGVVVVSIQHTPIDPLATLRIFADLDTVFVELARHMELQLAEPQLNRGLVTSAVIPYNEWGELTSSGPGRSLVLVAGQPVRLSREHNCQASGLQSRSHIGDGEMYREGGKIRVRARGEGRVVRYCSTQRAWELEIDGVKMLLGYWWFDVAVRGAVQRIPIFNPNTNGGKSFKAVVGKVMSNKVSKVEFQDVPVELEEKDEVITVVTELAEDVQNKCVVNNIKNIPVTTEKDLKEEATNSEVKSNESKKDHTDNENISKDIHQEPKDKIEKFASFVVPTEPLSPTKDFVDLNEDSCKEEEEEILYTDPDVALSRVEDKPVELDGAEYVRHLLTDNEDMPGMEDSPEMTTTITTEAVLAENE